MAAESFVSVGTGVEPLWARARGYALCFRPMEAVDADAHDWPAVACASEVREFRREMCLPGTVETVEGDEDSALWSNALNLLQQLHQDR
ncbi:hypothetical protein QFZ46_000796 [Microbacterium murale]|uniref:Uncharacterized protein n=1 Tax=Microbacterium murale TaxID=1081040 RepID=A0ABU0P5M7_9MICO|nr:hypothetical protein [Microbacterium murale]